MSIGFIQGPVKLFENTGNMRFVEKGQFTVNGKPINAHDGGPCIVDWDSDGVLDLLVGDGEGNVHFYRGKAKGSLELVADTDSALIKQAQNGAWTARTPDKKSPVGFSPAQPGARVKPYAADWNGDGKLDLLVGDYIQIAKPKLKLTAAQQKELKALKAKQKTMNERMSKTHQRMQDAVLKKMGLKQFPMNMDREQMNAYSKAWQEVSEKDKDYKKLNAEWMAMYQKLGKLEAQPEGTGFVWVYLRK